MSATISSMFNEPITVRAFLLGWWYRCDIEGYADDDMTWTSSKFG